MHQHDIHRCDSEKNLAETCGVRLLPSADTLRDAVSEFNILTPLLSEADPAVGAEGGIDPLGLYTIADALAVRLVRGVRERQQHPRYVTALAVSLSVCESFAEDAISRDGVSEPWQVFEWHLVEGLVRSARGGELRGVPGSLKAARAFREGVPLSAPRYLKTPTVFGIHGIYRILSRDLDVEQGGRLGDFGCELLDVWSREQSLPGFFGSGSGGGRAVKSQIINAIRDGLDRGATARSAAWEGWSFFQRHLEPHRAGQAEARLIQGAMRNDSLSFRRDVFDYLVSKRGAAIWKMEHEKQSRDRDEAALHAAMRVEVSPALRELLDAIGAYERIARLLQDAFDDALCEMTRQRGATSITKLSELLNVRRAAKEVPAAFGETGERLSQFGLTDEYQHSFVSLAERCSPTDWINSLLEHHRRVQREKPPAGKNPWFERSANGSFCIRTLYKREEPGRGDYRYVHAYRTQPLWSFAQDLGLVS